MADCCHSTSSGNNSTLIRSSQSGDAYIATDGGSVTQRVTYAYDAFGNRIEREAWDGSTTTTTRYGLDGWDTAKPSPVANEAFDAWAELDENNDLVLRRRAEPSP